MGWWEWFSEASSRPTPILQHCIFLPEFLSFCWQKNAKLAAYHFSCKPLLLIKNSAINTRLNLKPVMRIKQ